VIAQYYDLVRLGRAGYAGVQAACYRTAQHVAAALPTLGPFDVIFDGDPTRGIPAVSWRLRADADPGWNLFDLADRLRAAGWLVPAYPLPPDRTDLVVQRVLVRHGVSRDMADLLLRDVERAIATLQRHPPSLSMTEAEAGGFNHDARAPRTTAAGQKVGTRR
jgi:glutamate decarboxylase